MENEKIKILTIDDNMDNLITLKALLNESFFDVEVLSALNGQEGLDLAGDRDPDVILLDIVMPEMDGFEVCSRLKADGELCEIPVVFLTAIKGDKENRIKALKCGAEAFLSKPIEETELTAQIRAMLKIRALNRRKRDENAQLAKLVSERTYELEKSNLATMRALDELRKENEARKRTEESLLKSEEKYRQIAENVSDVVWTTDLNIKTNYITPSCEKMFGETTEEHMNHTLEEKYTQESLEKVKSIFLEEMKNEKDPKINKKRTRIIEVEHYKPDGSKIWISMHVSFLRDRDGRVVGFQGVSRDISDLKRAERELKASVESYITIFNQSPIGMAVIDSLTGCIYNANPKFGEITGRTSEELQNTDWMSITFPNEIWEELNFLKQVNEGKISNYNIDKRFIRPDDSIVWTNMTVAPLKIENSHKLHLCMIIDITEKKAKEQEIAYLSYHDILTGLCNRAIFEEKVRQLDVKAQLPLSIITCDINGLKFINDSLGHSEGDKLLIEMAEILEKVCGEEGVIARIGGDEFSVLLPQTTNKEARILLDKISKVLIENKDANNKESMLLSVSFGCATKTSVIEIFGDVEKIAEDNMYRHKLLERKSLHSSLISSIMTTLFEKNHQTQEHALRLVELSSMLGKKLELSEEQLNELELLSRLHDIGKISIDDKILSKPDKLTDDEWMEIKKHPEKGYRIASATPALEPIAELILGHHERWDGNGYPQGLSGKDIPLLSRIIAIVDSYDAMTSMRPYRNALSIDQAMKEIQDNGGTQFDPELAKMFLEMMTQK